MLFCDLVYKQRFLDREMVDLGRCKLPVGNTYRQQLQERVKQFQQGK